METIFDQTSVADLEGFISDLKVTKAGCQAHVGQLVAEATMGALGAAEAELCDAFVNAMAGAAPIERLLLCLIALKNQAPAERSVQ